MITIVGHMDMMYQITMTQLHAQNHCTDMYSQQPNTTHAMDLIRMSIKPNTHNLADVDVAVVTFD